MLVVPASPPVAQPVHDAFGIARPAVVPVRVQAEEHAAPRMPDFQDSYFLTHAYNDTILLSNQQYEKACRPGIEIPGIPARKLVMDDARMFAAVLKASRKSGKSKKGDAH